MPWRSVLFRAMPWLPSAKECKGYHDRLYGCWGELCDKIRQHTTFAKDDITFLACIAQMRDLDTGAASLSLIAPGNRRVYYFPLMLCTLHVVCTLHMSLSPCACMRPQEGCAQAAAPLLQPLYARHADAY
jgi:hypothetical protein